MAVVVSEDKGSSLGSPFRLVQGDGDEAPATQDIRGTR